MKILIVEDDAGYRDILQRYLNGLGDEIVFTDTWEKAQPHYGADVFWLDIFIPPHGEKKIKLEMGIIRATNSHAVIFVVSGLCDPNLKREMIAAGADAFVCKHDVATRSQVIALMLSALMQAEGRGKPATKYLQKARELLAENPAIG